MCEIWTNRKGHTCAAHVNTNTHACIITRTDARPNARLPACMHESAFNFTGREVIGVFNEDLAVWLFCEFRGDVHKVFYFELRCAENSSGLTAVATPPTSLVQLLHVIHSCNHIFLIGNPTSHSV